jgi:probable rRNA maturation factor
MRSDVLIVEIIDHQQEVDLPDDWLLLLRKAAEGVWSLLDEYRCQIHHLETIQVLEIAFVGTGDSDRIHREFMDVPGETDVITFLHGELVICPMVAKQQAEDHGEPLLRELLRYIIHGMLHLAGHEDDQENSRIMMEMAQEKLVAYAWENGDFASKS